MDITGESLIGADAIRGHEADFRATDPATGAALEPAFAGAGAAELERACALAEAAFDRYRDTSLEARAGFLETIAEQILALGDALIVRACAETGLPRGRIEGERGRTVGQLRLFAAVVRAGHWIDARIDPAQPDRKPLARADIRQRHIAVGPVAVFGASNFPLAFSVAGGDTASALAAGCPVVVKAHPAHPGTSELVGRAIQAAAAACDMPGGVFSLLQGAGNWLGGALVADARIKSVGFTGSRAGGLALVRIAQDRREPIPVFAEMSSINPAILLPGALTVRAAAIGKGFVASLIMGAGQFCTNPGLILALDGPELDGFIAAASAALRETLPTTMLHAGIGAAYQRGIERVAATVGVETLARSQPASGVTQVPAMLFATTAAQLLADPSLAEEVFGAASLVVRCPDLASIRAVLEQLEGQLTITLQMEDSDLTAAQALLPTLERRAGRVLVNGWPTGVEVGHAMVHGGPFPATSDTRTTSVGTLAIRRFLRPVAYQDFPAELLPPSLRDGNPDRVWRLLDGTITPPG